LPEAASLRRASGDAGQGVLLAVVGPSGVGKDSLIAHARTVFAFDPSVLFVRRAVTRPAMAAAEDHDCLSPDEFAAALAAGRFAVSWQAHGLSYGIPAAVRAHLATGGVAVVNGSRAALADIASVFGNVVTVHVTARPDILAARLAGRSARPKPIWRAGWNARQSPCRSAAGWSRSTTAAHSTPLPKPSWR